MHAHSYAACLQQLSGRAQLAGFYDDNAERGRSAAEKFGVPFFDSCNNLFNSVEGVMVCSENAKHEEHVLLAAQAGKPVLCEKPISTSIPSARMMMNACQSHGVQLMIAFPCRYNAPIVRMRQLIAGGVLGKILAMKGTNHGSMPGGWFVDRELAGGGAVMDHAVHVVDVWRWILGREAVSVYAEAGQLFYPDISIDDAGLLSLEFEGGVFATLDTSWSRPKASFPIWGDVTMEIVCEKGSITLDAFNQKIEVYNNDAVRARWDCWTDNIDLGLVNAFVKMIQENGNSPITGYDGLKAMEAALGAYRSIERGEPVALPLEA